MVLVTANYYYDNNPNETDFHFSGSGSFSGDCDGSGDLGPTTGGTRTDEPTDPPTDESATSQL